VGEFQALSRHAALPIHSSCGRITRTDTQFVSPLPIRIGCRTSSGTLVRTFAAAISI